MWHWALGKLEEAGTWDQDCRFLIRRSLFRVVSNVHKTIHTWTRVIACTLSQVIWFHVFVKVHANLLRLACGSTVHYEDEMGDD